MVEIYTALSLNWSAVHTPHSSIPSYLPPATSQDTQPTPEFLGNGHSHRQALHAAERVLNINLAPAPQQPSPPTTNTVFSSGVLDAEPLTAAINSVPLDSPLGSLDSALEELSNLWTSHAIRYDSPRYLAHLNCPITPASFAGSIISAGMNTAVESWDQGRSAPLIEDRLIRWSASIAGMDPRLASGVFTSGGTQSNLQALYTAREKALAAGAAFSSLRILCSAEAHYSIARSAHLLGLPDSAVVRIPSTANGSMDITALRDTIDALSNNAVENAEESHTTDDDITPAIACLVLTAGTTDLGGIDPLAQAISLAHEHNIYVHVDCAYGGALLLSSIPERRALLAGLNNADSFSLDFHKSFFQPVSCSALIYRDRTDLSFVTWHADYLNPEHDPRLNLADRSLQTTRRFDALKLWLSLRVDGAASLGHAFDTCCTTATAAAQLIEQHPELELLTSPPLSTVMFRYMPPTLSTHASNMPPAEHTAQLNRINESIRRQLFENNELIIASTTRDDTTYLKFTILNPQLTLDDLRFALDTICATGAKEES